MEIWEKVLVRLISCSFASKTTGFPSTIEKKIKSMKTMMIDYVFVIKSHSSRSVLIKILIHSKTFHPPHPGVQ